MDRRAYNVEQRVHVLRGPDVPADRCRVKLSESCARSHEQQIEAGRELDLAMIASR